MDLKSRGSSRFKRKGSNRSKARGGSGGKGVGGRWSSKGGRGGFGSSKWGSGGGRGGTGGEDPVTGEKGVPRDRPLSSGAAKNRAGLDVLDQVGGAGAVVVGDAEFCVDVEFKAENEFGLQLEAEREF